MARPLHFHQVESIDSESGAHLKSRDEWLQPLTPLSLRVVRTSQIPFIIVKMAKKTKIKLFAVRTKVVDPLWPLGCTVAIIGAMWFFLWKVPARVEKRVFLVVPLFWPLSVHVGVA